MYIVLKIVRERQAGISRTALRRRPGYAISISPIMRFNPVRKAFNQVIPAKFKMNNKPDTSTNAMLIRAPLDIQEVFRLLMTFIEFIGRPTSEVRTRRPNITNIADSAETELTT